MAEGDNYLAMALNLLRRAEKLADPEKRAGLEALAEHYRIQAERVRHMSALLSDCPKNKRRSNWPSPMSAIGPKRTHKSLAK